MSKVVKLSTNDRIFKAQEYIDQKRKERRENPSFLVLILRAIIVITGIVVSLLMFGQIVMRYFFGFSIYGLEELMSFFAVWLYFIGSTHGTWDRGHISASLVDVITKPGFKQQFVKVISSLITVILSAWMTQWTFDYVMRAYKRNLMSLEVGISMLWVNAGMVVGMVLMTYYFLVELYEEFQILRGRE